MPSSAIGRFRMLAGVAVLAALVAAAPSAGAGRRPTLRFQVFSHTPQKMDSILWTGSQFLEVENTANTIWAAPASGSPIRQFATMPKLVEETRCVLSPGAYGFPSGAIFCHSPDDKIYEISGDGTKTQVLATLPVPPGTVADGAIAFDDVGRFGHRLVAATGRSGAGQPPGGDVYTIDAAGKVEKVGSYAGPGGADELAIAPAGFGSVGGEALLAVDGGKGVGRVVAIDAGGKTRTILTLDDGPNPIVAIPKPGGSGGDADGSSQPKPGFYLTDDSTGYVYYAPAASLAPWAGDLLVGSETEAHFWIVSPRGQGFAATRVRHDLRGGQYSLEGGTFVR